MSATTMLGSTTWRVYTPVGPMYYEPADPTLDFIPDLPPNGLRLAWMPDEFGCIEACVATIFGVDFDDVPAGPRGDHTKADELEARERLDAWLADRGYRMRRVQITRELLSRYWIGVSADPRPGWSHCVVCAVRRVVHDPALRWGLSLPPGLAVEPVTRLDEAIVFDRLEDR